MESAESRARNRRRTKDLVTRRGISLSPSDDQKLVELADRLYGGNVSLLIRKLIERAMDGEQAEQKDPVAA